VQKLPVGVAISVAFHAFVIAWVIVYQLFASAEAAEVATKPPVSIEIVTALPPEPEPVAVAVIEEAPAAAIAPTPAPLPKPRAAIARTAITATTATAVIEPGPPATVEPVPSTGRVFAMRTPKRPDLSIRSDYRDALDHAPKGSTPQRDVPETGKLQPSGGGTYRSDEGVFTAKVGKDGSVDLKDAKNFRISVPNPAKIPKAIKTWADQENKTPDDPERVAVNNNRPADTDTRPDHGKTVPVVRGGFDVTDALLRRKGQDPYFSKKLKYLDSTRDERVQIGSKYKAAQLKQATQLMQKNLEAVFASTQDPAARKQGMFELWDDCAETGEAAVIEAGRAARQLVVGTIRSRFPAGGPQAFTTAELAALNQRRHSKAVFAPYE
jgi:hypothetical protein